MIKICIQCNKEYNVDNFRSDKSKFCSIICANNYKNLHNRIVKKCKVCNKEFVCGKTEGKWKVSCSIKCSDELKQKIKNESKIFKKCVNCGNEFVAYKCHPYKICCSLECRKKWVLRFKIKEVCCICGKEKYVAPSKHTAMNPICGSKECRSKQQSIIKEGSLNPNYKGRVKKVNCIVCGTECKDFCGNKKFCSVGCKSKWQKENLKGENNPFYGKHHTDDVKKLLSILFSKHEVQNINKAIRHTDKMRKWRDAVYQRDNWTCQNCFDRGRADHVVVLNAHHKIFLSELIEMYPNVDVNYKEDMLSVKNDNFFFNVDNGITLCYPCHKKAHGIEEVLDGNE